MMEIKTRLREINSDVEIVDKDYVSSVHKMKCKCAKCGHFWKVRWADLRHAHGCPRCYQRSKRLTLDEIVARLNRINPSIKITSTKYASSLSPLRCMCKVCNNSWQTTWNCLKEGYSCPTCNRNGGIAERRLVKFAAKVLGFKLTPANPTHVPWLLGLFLDGYNEQHKVAIEYQGEQHYKPVWGLHNLQDTKRRDERKRVLCYRHGVKLIRVPFWMLKGLDWQDKVRQFISRRLACCKVATNVN